MDFLNTTNLFSRLTPSPSPSVTDLKIKGKVRSTVKGSASTISEYVYNDIQQVKQEIKSFNERTKIFTSNPLYYKLYKLIEQNQSNELNNLKSKYEYNFTNDYFKNLVSLYKRFLNELDDYLKILQNNYHNGVLKTHIQSSNRNHRGTKRPLPNDDDGNHSKSIDDAPEDLLDPLSYELFNDPVITPSGITYEKTLIIDHLNKNGQFDPLTRQSLHPHQLYPNLAIKNSVNNFVNQCN